MKIILKKMLSEIWQPNRLSAPSRSVSGEDVEKIAWEASKMMHGFQSAGVSSEITKRDNYDYWLICATIKYYSQNSKD